MRLGNVAVLAIAFAATPAVAASLDIRFDSVSALRLDLPRPAIELAASGPIAATLSLACDQAPPMPERTFYPMWDAIELTFDASALEAALAAPTGEALGAAQAAIGDDVGTFLVREESARPVLDDTAQGAGRYRLAIQTSNNRLTGRVGTEEILTRFADGRGFVVTLVAAGAPLELRLSASTDAIGTAATDLRAACAAFHRPQ